MKKKIAILLLTLTTVLNSATCFAAPIGTYKSPYKPVTSQSWYQSLQKNLGTIKVSIPSVNIVLK